MPTAAEIDGDFTNTPFRRKIYNPYSTRLVGNNFVRDEFRCDASGTPLPGNAQRQQNQAIGAPCFKIPQALIFAPMQSFFHTYSPTPNLTGDSTNNFAQIRPSTNNSNSFQVRIDHHFSDRDTIFFRFTQQNVTVFNPIGTEGSTAGSGKGRNYGGAWTHTFTPTFIFDIRAGYAGRPSVDSSQQNQHEAGTDPLNQSGFVDVDKYGLLVTLQNWTAGGNNNFGVRGPDLEATTWPDATAFSGNANANVENGPGGGATIQNFFDPSTARSGAPFNLQVTGDLANLRGSAPGNAPSGYLRPNLIADPFTPGDVAANPDPACQKRFRRAAKQRTQYEQLRVGLIHALSVFRQVRLEVSAATCFAASRSSTRTFRCSRVFRFEKTGSCSSGWKLSTASTFRTGTRPRTAT